MKLHHLLVVAILGGFFVFTFAVGCSNSPTETQFAQGDEGFWTTGDDDITITKKKVAAKKKVKKKATRVYKARIKKKAAAKKTAGTGLGHLTYRKKRVEGEAPFFFGVVVRDLSEIINATLNIGHAENGTGSREVAYLYMAENGETGTATRTGLLMRGEISQSDLNQAEISILDLVHYLSEGEVFVNVATVMYPEGEIAGQLMEVDMTPLRKKKITRK